MNKICRSCHQQKPLTDFYNHARSRDGKKSQCKVCDKAASRRYRRSPRGRAMRQLRRYRDRQKIRARDAVSNAIKRGKLPRAQACHCLHCGHQATMYHHYKGYKNEHFLDVMPLCAACHRLADAQMDGEDLGTEGLPLFEVERNGRE